jgi:hypothetical protein
MVFRIFCGPGYHVKRRTRHQSWSGTLSTCRSLFFMPLSPLLLSISGEMARVMALGESDGNGCGLCFFLVSPAARALDPGQRQQKAGDGGQRRERPLEAICRLPNQAVSIISVVNRLSPEHVASASALGGSSRFSLVVSPDNCRATIRTLDVSIVIVSACDAQRDSPMVAGFIRFWLLSSARAHTTCRLPAWCTFNASNQSLQPLRTNGATLRDKRELRVTCRASWS